MWNGTSFPLVSITNMLKQMKHFNCTSKQIDESRWENPRQLENQPSQKPVLLKKIWNAQKSVPTIPKHLGNLRFQVFISQQNLGQSRKSKWDFPTYETQAFFPLNNSTWSWIQHKFGIHYRSPFISSKGHCFLFYFSQTWLDRSILPSWVIIWTHLSHDSLLFLAWTLHGWKMPAHMVFSIYCVTKKYCFRSTITFTCSIHEVLL